MVRNPPSNAGDVDSSLVRELRSRTPQDLRGDEAFTPQLRSPCTAARKRPASHSDELTWHKERSQAPQLRPEAAKNK